MLYMSYHASPYPFTEESPPSPISSYGMDKLACENYGKIAWHNYQVPNASLRLSNVYGPDQNVRNGYGGVIQRFIEACADDQPITIFGDGSQTRDFYIDDAVWALIASMDAQALHTREVLNVSTGIKTSITALAKNIHSLMQGNNRIIYDAHRTSDIRRSVGTPQKFERIFNEYVPTSLETGLAQMIKYRARVA